jgi:xylulose-5-phosphate/fructose-6-phosphate phosphoketolase
MAATSTAVKRRSDDGAQAAAAGPLSPEELRQMHAYWRAANYLSVGQIYLMDNPLLKEPLQLKHVKPRLLGHWGTTSGQNFLYVHLNRIIKKYDLNMLYISGPGHGGPALVANAYLEGTYSEVYPNIGQDEAGMRRLFTQFSFPGGIPSHVAPETPGSIHEGGELGYALSHAYGAAFDNPDLIGRVRHRRRRGRDGAAGHRLARQQVPQPGPRRLRAAHPAPQRLQDRQPHGARPHRP